MVLVLVEVPPEMTATILSYRNLRRWRNKLQTLAQAKNSPAKSITENQSMDKAMDRVGISRAP